MKDNLLTRKQLSTLINLSDSTINRMEKKGLPVYRVGTGKPRYDGDEVLRWMKQIGKGNK